MTPALRFTLVVLPKSIGAFVMIVVSPPITMPSRFTTVLWDGFVCQIAYVPDRFVLVAAIAALPVVTAVVEVVAPQVPLLACSSGSPG